MGYYTKFWKWRDRRETECADCGVSAVDADEIHIHHENGRHFQNNRENLTPLCADCHRERHKDMDTVTTVDEWKEAFKDELIES